MKSIDVIIPCYRSEFTIKRVVDGIFEAIGEEYKTRVILTNDCSPDNVWDVIESLCTDNHNVIGIDLSRNFGQQSARMAALPFVESDYVVFMDDDGQHDPDFIVEMINKIDDGYDIVYADFISKKQAKWKTLGSNIHQLSAEWLEEKPKGIHTSSFFVVKRYIIDSLKQYPSPSPVVLGYLMKSTQNITCIPVPHKCRIEGESGYSLKKLIRLWIRSATSFSIVPLRISGYLGLISAAIGVVLAVITVVKKLMNPQIVAGYTSTIVVLLVFFGMVFMMLGLMGEYIGRMFMTINCVPQYVIKKTIQYREDSSLDSKKD